MNLTYKMKKIEIICIEPEILTLEQLNTNMISKFTKQLKELDNYKNKLTKKNIELTYRF